MVEQQLEHKKKRDRSPSYPGIDLEEAISKASALYREEGKHAAPVEVILHHWDYTSPKSSGGLVALAALKKFGLLIDEGTGKGRQARISEDAFHILVDDIPNSPERLRLIQKAALTPSIHQELWDQYAGNLPSDSTLKVQLRNRGFTERAATAFIEEFHETIAYANLSNPASISTGDGDQGKDRKKPEFKGTDLFSLLNPFEEPKKKMEQQVLKREQQPKQREQQIIRIPLPGNEWIAMQLPVPLSETAWQQMEAVLKAMKPGLVEFSLPQQQPVSVSPKGIAHENRLTEEAQTLVAKVYDGGIPMYVTSHLERIARDNGIEVTPQMLPNEIMDKLRALAND